MDLFGFPLSDVGAGVLVAGFVVFVATGRLIPKGRADRELDFRDEMVKLARAEADTWKAVAVESERVNNVVRQYNTEQMSQIARLVDAGEETTRLMVVLRDYIASQHISGGGDVAHAE